MAELRDKFEAANVIAMWEQELRPNRPPTASHIWRWEAMNPLIGEAADAVNMEDAERRVLILRNPGLPPGRDGAAPNLSVNLQVLMPGEKARPHRHSMHALRFVLEGDGTTTTVVEGKPCPMLPGDLVLTPGTTWHEHVNAGSKRAVWVDALDVPLHGYLDSRVFEPGPVTNLITPPPDAVYAAGLSTEGGEQRWSYSPMFRYPWDATAKALDAMPASADGSRRLRYTNPVTGGAILSTIDCYVLGLAKGIETEAYRTNSNCVCVAFEGEGETRAGDDVIQWKPKDIFSLPHGQWVTHKAASPARLFQITDREIFRRLGFLRDETRH